MAKSRLLDRIGWDAYLRPFLFKKLPPETGWSATLGSLCAMLFAVMAVTGIFLAMYYNPSPDKAYQSIDFIMNEVPLGRILRGLHHWGAGAMVLVVFLHLLTNFLSGSFKAPRDVTWGAGAVLFLLTLGLGFTGYLLPWDMKAYWATMVSSSIPRDLPVVGDLITKVILGGDMMSGLTLTRFYAIHTLLLPTLLAVFAAFHIYLVRVHGLAEAPGEKKEPAGDKVYRFYPEHAFRSALVFTAVFVVLLGLAVWGSVPREDIAGTIIDSYLPRPEWYFMWLFQMLTLFSGSWETVGSLAVPFLLLVLLFSVPYLGRSTLLGAARRPLPLALGVTAVLGILYLTLLGFSSAEPYGREIMVPDRQLTAAENRGLYLYADRDCAYCHQIRGTGGHRTGPDLANTAAKGRSRDYLVKYIKDPQAISTTSVMPKYELPGADLQALATFTLSLADLDRNGGRMVKTADILKTPQAAGPTASIGNPVAGSNP